MELEKLKTEIEEKWSGRIKIRDITGSFCEAECGVPVLVDLCGFLFREKSMNFAGLIVEEETKEWQLRYVFYSGETGWVHVLVRATLEGKTFPSITGPVHAADWHEREAEDLFGLVFTGHPRLGDFILHDDVWQEGVEPMRRKFDPQKAMCHRKPAEDWRPRHIVQEPGAFVMPVGPKYSGISEAVHFLLETVGEDVIRAIPRLFYKWRAVEKLGECKTPENVLLMAERFAADTAFAHGLAFCQAVETVCGVMVPERARILRIFLAELERLRHHAGAIQKICASTALAVAASQAAIIEEDLLRVCGEMTGHRYLFGVLALGGLLFDPANAACKKALEQAERITNRINVLEKHLYFSSSFLDRLEEVGIVEHTAAKSYGLLGPIARASGIDSDMRRARAYSGYEKFVFDIPVEEEGDGYARLRLLFAECRQSMRIMEQAVNALTEGSVRTVMELKPGAGMGWVEAPRGGAFHWVRVNRSGRIDRWRIIPPSFANWHGFHLSVENFAFQDFPIILSTFGLSVAENDR